LFIGTQNAGSIYYGGRSPFEGLIDEVSLYNRALSASEIQATFNAGSADMCQDPVTCNGHLVTILGTAGPDILVGTDGPDVIHGLGHNDGIVGPSLSSAPGRRRQWPDSRVTARA
jgi:hypothetical protein